jgi:hypothetical protein
VKPLAFDALERRHVGYLEDRRGRWTHDTEWGAAMPHSEATRRLPTREAIRTVAIARAAERLLGDSIVGRRGRFGARDNECARWSAEAKYAWARALMELLRWAAPPRQIV